MTNGYDSSMQLDSVLRHVRHIPPFGGVGETQMICLLKTFGRRRLCFCLYISAAGSCGMILIDWG